MIFSGYENNHFFVRLTRDMRMVDAFDVLHRGYRLVDGYLLLLKKREYFEREAEFEFIV